MGGQKTTSTNDYGFFQKPTWQGLQDFQAWRPERSALPALQPAAGLPLARLTRQRERMQRQNSRRYDAMRAGLEGISQQEGQAYRDEMFDATTSSAAGSLVRLQD